MVNEMQVEQQGVGRAPSPPATETSGTASVIRVGLRLLQLGPVLILLVLVVVMALIAPYFATGKNLQNVGVQAAALAILALGQLLVILTRGIDLSVGSVISLTTVVGALLFSRHGASTVEVVVLMLLVGGAVGLFNGAAFVYGRVPHPFVVTLGTLGAMSGLALLLAHGVAVEGMPKAINSLGQDFVGPIPVSVILVVLCAVLAAVLTGRTQYGRWVYAVGGNPEGARRVGIPVNKVLVSVYVLSGVAAAVAALVIAGRTDTGDPTAGQSLELDAIAAVIIGGASFFGGRGTVSGVIAGALVITVIRNGLNLLNVSPYVQAIVIGFVVIVAVELDVLRAWLETRFRSLQAEARA